MPLRIWVVSKRTHGLGLLVAFALGVSGCASVPSAHSFDTRSPLPAEVELSQVAFYPQTQDQCGPAALATVLHHAGVARTLEQLAADVYVPQRQGSFALEMLGGARRAGVVPYVLKGQPQALWQEVAAGHPVVVLQNLRWDWLPLWHYAVVVGYDQAAGTVTLRSGDEKRLTMPVSEFTQSWAKAKQWAFVALPPDQLPATASAAEYVQAAITLERVAPLQAMQAYQTALQAWPDHLEARLALGNSYYQQRDLQSAQTQYELATTAHPNAADAWNNLAQVLYETHQEAPAHAAIAKALALGGPRLERYKLTALEHPVR
jgi:TolA-binding protein